MCVTLSEPEVTKLVLFSFLLLRLLLVPSGWIFGIFHAAREEGRIAFVLF